MRQWYAVLNDEVYAFTKISARDEFCEKTGALRIYAHDRHKHFDVNNAHKSTKNSDTAMKRARCSSLYTNTQSTLERAIKERRKHFKKYASK